jgi:hypothetical protein
MPILHTCFVVTLSENNKLCSLTENVKSCRKIPHKSLQEKRTSNTGSIQMENRVLVLGGPDFYGEMVHITKVCITRGRVIPSSSMLTQGSGPYKLLALGRVQINIIIYTKCI